MRRLREAPERTAILTDLDGSLAEIVDRPDGTSLAAGAREVLEAISGRYAVAGVITGRRSSEAREIVGLEPLVYIGNHGAEALVPGRSDPEPTAALEGQEHRAGEFIEALGSQRLDDAKLTLEDKGPIQALHWRSAGDPQAAEDAAEEIAAEAREAGLWIHRGRKVLELRPPVEADKGLALENLLEKRDEIRMAFYGGDDCTDADVFEAMDSLVADGRLHHAVSVAVVSSETPPEVEAAAELSVGGVGEYVSLLEGLV